MEKSISSLVKRAKHFAASDHLLDKVINDEEIIKAPKQLKNGKSTGNDATCNEMIVSCSYKIHRCYNTVI